MAGTRDATPMAYDKAKAATHGVKPEDIDFLQPYKEYVMLPFNQSSRHFTLGPNFPSVLENLKEFIPMLNPDDAYYKYENPCKFDNFDRIWVCPWSDKPETQEAFVQLYRELEPKYGDTWRMAGIYDSLKFCTIGFGESRDFVEAVLGFWSGTSNVFCFPWGPMTPTLLDVCVITGLPAIVTVAVDGNVKDDDAAAAVVGQPMSYGHFISENKGKIRLTAGEQMNSAEAALAMLYHCLHETRHNQGSTLCGPTWLLHFWLYMYFPSLKQEGIFPVGNGEPLCLGVQQFNKPTFNGMQAFKIVFESIPDVVVMVRQLSQDWWHKSFDDICHSVTESGKWNNTGLFGLTSVWSHLLSARDIFYGSKSLQSQNVGADMHAEYYPANMVARQFEFAQSVPHFEVSCRNTGRLGREKLTMENLVIVHGSDEESDSQESDKGSVASGVSIAAIKAMSETEEVYGTRYNQLKTLLSAIQTSLVDDSMAAAIGLISTEAAQKEIECQTVGTASNSPTTMDQARPEQPEVVSTARRNVVSEGALQEVPPNDQEPLEVTPLQSIPASPP
ncbi:OLC1v1004966C1 [Oldenlandia corymbosa var. corymbosa]|uniref:OLC1v1004966C1 n=1 Tax=Oldenlandia corymbosa var. corymbosa TaxID=529605 RepID=A0AAV1DDH9_OLDCO|nr:OLC1v1004966C1 [Oldenlandia corymbosa var. corymbosa]